MTTFDLAEQLTLSEEAIINYVQVNIDFDWSTVTPIAVSLPGQDKTFELNDFQSEKVLNYFRS